MKSQKYLYLLCVLVASIVFASPARAEIVGSWNFDEGLASGDTVLDSSIYSNHGTITGATRTSASHSGNALDFNGSSSNYVDMGNDASLSPRIAITIVAWVNPHTAGGGNYGRIISKFAPSRGWEFHLGDNHGSKLGLKINGKNLWSEAGSLVGAWHHVAVVYRSGVGAKFYVDGVLAGTASNHTNPIISNNSNVQIGKMATRTDKSFNGIIDELSIYNNTLSASEIMILAKCSDGTTQAWEECDDGNNIDNDGCDSNCTYPTCGNDIVNPGEECDDGENDPLDGCSPTCYLECGDGDIVTPEECDNGRECSEGGAACDIDDPNSCGGDLSLCKPQNNDTCDNNCIIEECGNGVLQPWTGEECDDDNTDNNDGCDSECIIEECGNGKQQVGEDCDDGKTCDGPGYAECTGDSDCSDGDGLCKVRNGDGCDNDEANGGNCTVSDCGNGVIAGGEQCDNGPDDPDDCCDDTCMLKAAASSCGSPSNTVCDNPDTCDAVGTCRNNRKPNGKNCDGDNNVCTGIDRCNNGICRVATKELNCDDNKPCTTDTCDPVTGCDNTHTGVETCDDDDVCNGLEQCNGKVCEVVTPPEPCPDDGNPCTTNNCDPVDGCVISDVASGAPCADFNQCNGDETCDGAGDCQPGTPEACDDGVNINDGEGCDSDCVAEVCGNGKQQFGEECDDGNSDNTDCCLNDCTKNLVCGDGVKCWTEACDEPPIGNGDGCDNDPTTGNCTPTACGNGVLTGTEECDDGNKISGDGCTKKCVIEYCGDGIVNDSGTEECDDSNNIDGDCCSATCTIEPVVCGDGVTCGDEQCENDTNLTCKDKITGADTTTDCTADPGVCDASNNEICAPANNDGCDFKCDIELCGNDIYQPWFITSVGVGEECDNDTNFFCYIDGLSTVTSCTDDTDCDTGKGEACGPESKDGCGPTCLKEVCGDGIVNGTEQCDDGKTCDSPSYGVCTDDSECSTGDGLCKVRNGDGCDNDSLNDGNCSHSTCGNGVRTGSEECDYGPDPYDPDGCCDADCKFVGSGTSCGDPTDDECTNSDTCNDVGVCLGNHEPAATACGDPTSGDCNGADTCDGNGSCQINLVPVDTACGDPADTDCTNPDTCDGNGLCLGNHEPAATACGDTADTTCTDPDTCDGSGLCLDNHALDTTACDDSEFCTVSDACTSGVCGGAQRDCSALDDECNDGVCDETGNTCIAQPKADTTACDDGVYCTENDTCTAGVCDGAQRDCSGLTDDCNDGVCDETGNTCVAQPKADTTACDDGEYCTVSDTCTAGVCDGGQRDCSALDDQCNDGVCDETGNTCIAQPKADTTACDDGKYCTVSDACMAGVCDGGQRDCTALADQCNDGVCDETGDVCAAQPKADTTACDDGVYCTENDTCTAGVCDGAQRDCSGLTDDCNDGVCDETGNTCVAQPKADTTACDDGEYCTVSDTCTAGVCDGGQRDCSALADQCNDGVCDETGNTCVAQPKADTTACDDGVYCTENDTCTAGVCDGAQRDCSGLTDDCNDGVCDETGNTCVAQPKADTTACDDGEYCTVSDTCTAGVCDGGQRDCSALADQCNDGVCDETGNTCIAQPKADTTACDDGVYCTVSDTCTAGVCDGAQRDCSALDDDCNDGACDETGNTCVAQPKADTTACDDGEYCTENDTCTAGVCDGAQRDCSGLTDDCNDGVCDETGNTCVAQPKADTTACDDGEYCTENDTCTAGVCDGAQRDCSALDDDCNDGACDETGDSCIAQAKADTTPCNDGEFCTEIDTCTSGVCGGTQRDCSGLGDECNDGVCDETGDSCIAQAKADTTPCNDGEFCTEIDTCTSGVCGGTQRDCTALADQCNDGVCDETGDTCSAQPKADDISCDDDNVCNGIDTCQTGVCTPGTPLADGESCDDDNVCNGVDTCQTGVCTVGTPLADGESCDDGDICNGVDTCQTEVCTPGTPLADDESCDDGDICNGVDTCQEGVCESGIPLDDDEPCDDGDVCNGVDTCQAGVCTVGTPPVCDDEDVCTGTETCDAVSGCQLGTDLDCDDNDVCTGTETCDPVAGCQPGTNLDCNDGKGCTDDSCDPVSGCQNDNNCDDEVICTDDICNIEGCEFVDDPEDDCFLANTPAGGNFTIFNQEQNGVVDIWFENVASAGTTTVDIWINDGSMEPPPPPPPSGTFSLGEVYYYIDTTAVVFGDCGGVPCEAEVCFIYDHSSLPPGQERRLKLQHFDETLTPPAWVDVTIAPPYPDLDNHEICGRVASFSPFTVTTPRRQFSNPPPSSDGDTESLSGRGCSVTPTLRNMSTGSAWANTLLLLSPLVVFGIRRRFKTGKK